MTKTILAIIGDTQIGSSTALAPPQFTIHNNDPRETQLVRHNELQKWLWDCWTEYWGYVRELAGCKGRHRKHRIVVVHMGDVIDGNHHGTRQIIQDVGDQLLVAKDVLTPIRDMADVFYGIIGTETHDGPAGADAIAIYRDLDVTEYGQHLMLEVDGKLHDFAHHGRVGRRPWTSAAASIGVEVMLDCGLSGLPCPDYIWRAHNHVIDDSGDRLEGTRVICLPSWQLKTAFANRVSANRRRSDIGGYIVNGGLIDNTRNRYHGQPDGRKVITI